MPWILSFYHIQISKPRLYVKLVNLVPSAPRMGEYSEDSFRARAMEMSELWRIPGSREEAVDEAEWPSSLGGGSRAFLEPVWS